MEYLLLIQLINFLIQVKIKKLLKTQLDYLNINVKDLYF